LAIDLSRDFEKLKEIRCRLKKNQFIAPLFQGFLFKKHIEEAYVEMHNCYSAGMNPENIYINND
jgi:predicted O-linked N-acetylglucosamine transferase (SPINDLY family)